MKRMGKYVTAPRLARICDVRVKTVHQWAERQLVPHFRTPGGHLRFKPRELVPWLRQTGFDVPQDLVEAAEAAPAAA